MCVCVCVYPNSVGMKTQPESKCPELLANYCDMLLRKTALSKKLSSEEIELKLKEVVRVCFVGSITQSSSPFPLRSPSFLLSSSLLAALGIEVRSE